MPRSRISARRSRFTGTAFLFRTALATALLALFASGRARPQGTSPEPIIGSAGRTEITEREFRERFELTPGLYRNRRDRLDEEKLITAYSLVAEKLLAEEALARGLEQERGYQDALAEVRKLLARDELYYREVRQKVTVSEQEVAAGTRQALRELLIRYLFFPSKDDARFVRSLITTPEQFRTIQVDSSIDVLRDTATVIWGDANHAIEQAAYAMHPGEVSPVVTAGEGFYILLLERERPSPFFTTLPPDVLSERVSSTIRFRKERGRAAVVVGSLLSTQRGYSPPATFARFAGELRTAFLSSSSGPPFTMSPGIASDMRVACRDILQDTLIVAGERVWSVEEAIDELQARGFVVREDARHRTGPRLYEAFREWVEHELLAQEALRRGLDRSSDVERRLAPWRDQLLASLMKARVAQGVSVSDEELLRFMSSRDSSGQLPSVRLRELHLATLDEVHQVFDRLEQGESFEDLVREFSRDPSTQSTGGLTPLFPIAEHPAIGAIAWDMEPGERYGPVADSSGFLLFELVEKHRVTPADDREGRALARQELRRMKQQRRLTLFLSGVGATRGYRVFDDRVVRIPLSAVPMLAYRLLGFGGRMFAVPFVDRQIEWLLVDPPQDVLVP
jgi:peptidyl-prolyl cis-trans isomerase C